MSDQEIELHVKAELSWDPRVDSEAVAVAVDDGVVTLRGTVPSYQARRNATDDAALVHGVTDVVNDLEVRLLDHQQREDADLRGAVLQALALDSLVPSTVDADVADGWVTLTGTASWQYQRAEAQTVAGNIGSVVGVTDGIDLVPSEPLAPDVEQSIGNALQRKARIDADNIRVATSGRTVTLRGTVNSWAARDEAEAAAWAAPGVTDVVDDLRISY